MLLIITSSLDGTVDLLLEELGDHPVFRFNIDLWSHYNFLIDADGFMIEDPLGRRADENSVSSCYWRKPHTATYGETPVGGSIENWLSVQNMYALREIWNACRNAGKARLVEAGAERRFGKVMQLRTASKYMTVPKWCYSKAPTVPEWSDRMVTKPFSAQFVSDGKLIYTTHVTPSRLDPAYPWFLQSEVAASHDLTVVYVAGKCFGFTLDRSLFEGVDWRVDINRVEQPWKDYCISDDLKSRVCGFMDEARLSYGRLDFLLVDGEPIFLEVNPNGQYAWLDRDGNQGMMSAVIEELTTSNPRKPIAAQLP